MLFLHIQWERGGEKVSSPSVTIKRAEIEGLLDYSHAFREHPLHLQPFSLCLSPREGGENCTLDLKGVTHPSSIYDSTKCARDFLEFRRGQFCTSASSVLAPIASGIFQRSAICKRYRDYFSDLLGTFTGSILSLPRIMERAINILTPFINITVSLSL